MKRELHHHAVPVLGQRTGGHTQRRVRTHTLTLTQIHQDTATERPRYIYSHLRMLTYTRAPCDESGRGQMWKTDKNNGAETAFCYLYQVNPGSLRAPTGPSCFPP